MLHTKDMDHRAHNMFISYTNQNHKLSLWRNHMLQFKRDVSMTRYFNLGWFFRLNHCICEFVWNCVISCKEMAIKHHLLVD